VTTAAIPRSPVGGSRERHCRAGETRRAFLIGATLLGLGGRLAAAQSGVRVSVTPPTAKPGDVLLLQIAGAPPDLRLEWDGRSLLVFPSAGGFSALVGLDLDVRPGLIGWRVTRPSVAKNGGALAAGAVKVRSRTFPTQKLTLPKGMVDLDTSALARVEAERGELQAALSVGASERLWRGPFRAPLEGGQPTGGYGLRRVINGQPRSPHTGYDWAAPVGTPVLAVNAGRAALVAEHFFAGRNVVLDHGLGLFTLYYHLDETRVAAGDLVARGQVIGTVGATGRVTGAHLHFGALLGGARVDPEALLALEVPAERLSP
jgi:murein DD-endopeptidase MepM/ murein hydrolase activator NlpD